MAKVNDNAERVLKARYYCKNEAGETIEDWKGLCRRVASGVAKAEEGENITKYTDIFFDMMFNLDFLPNSPTLFNAGKEKGLLSACFTLDVDDNMQSIMKAVTDAAMVFKMGGGVGLSFSALRPEGELIKTTGGTSSGPISFMRMFDTMTEVVKQGGKRRGALLGLLNVDHKDIDKFISCKAVEGQLSNFNISVGITDEFMYKVKAKDQQSLNLWNKIIDGAYNNGEPGVLFMTTINAANPVPHMGKIKSSNPCVTGDTMVAVADGRNAVSFKELADFGADVPVYTRNYKGQIDIRMMRNPRLTGEKQEIVKVSLDNGQSLRTTENHRFVLSSGEEREARNLAAGDSLSIMIKRVAPMDRFITNAGKNGGEYYWNQTSTMEKYVSDHRMIAKFHGLLKTMGEHFIVHHRDFNGLNNAISNFRIMTPKAHVRLHAERMRGEKNPMNRFPEKNWRNDPLKQLEMREKYHIGKKRSKETKQRQSESKKKLFADKPEYLTLLASRMSDVFYLSIEKRKQIALDRRDRLLSAAQAKTIYPCFWDEKQLMVTKKCEECGEDLVTRFDRREVASHRECYLKKLSNDPKTGKFTKVYANHKVVSIELCGFENVYNGTVDEFHNYYTGHFEEIVDGDKSFVYVNQKNCGEFLFIPYGSCNLGSINLSNMYKDKEVNWEKLEQTVRMAVRFLDDVITVNWFPLQEIKDITTRTRPIGLGVMGFADLLLKLEIRYDSSEGIDYAQEIMEFIKEKAYNESTILGKEKGSFPEFKKTELSKKYETLRNCMLTVIAPTGSLSLIAGCSSGIEPNFAWHTKMNRIDTVMEEVHPIAAKYVRLGETLPNYFVTAGEISPEWHIRMQAAFQAHTCSAISKTVNMPNTATREDVYKAYMLAWELKCKGVTIYREGSRSKEVLTKASKVTPKNQKVISMVYRERDGDLKGVTRKAKTGCGNSYITVNFDQWNYPIEVFKQVSSKGGCDAMAEGMARMTSLALRHGIDTSEIIKQLRSVKCSNAIAKGVGCLSCPDLMGRVLADLMHKQQNEITEATCPDCGAALESSEGCVKCSACGYSKCS